MCMKCYNQSDNIYYAVKIYKVQEQNDIEITVLQKAADKHLPGIVHLVEVLADSKCTYLVMELIDGINMLEYLSKNSLKRKIVSSAFNALWEIVRSVHSLKYAHGCICFKNIRYLEKSKEFRLIGFNNAKPISDHHDEQIDFWSLGVCIYTVLCGHPPFDLLTSSDTGTITNRIVNNDFDQDSEQWTALHKDIKCFIDQLLCSSIPTCSTGDFKLIQNVSALSVDCCEERIDENEKIIKIRAAYVKTQPANVQTQSAIEIELVPAINGLEVTTNGNDSKVNENSANHSDQESQSESNHNDVNGHVRKPASKRQRKNAQKDPLESENKKIKLDKSNALTSTASVPLLKPDEIKLERNLRQKVRIDYAQKMNTKSRKKEPTKAEESVSGNATQTTEINDEEVKKNPPKNKTGRGRGRPPKALLNEKSQTRTKIPTIPKTHSRPPAAFLTTLTCGNFTHQAVQTDFVHLWIPKREKTNFYCFERFNY